jgi:hypothetical protein
MLSCEKIQNPNVDCPAPVDSGFGSCPSCDLATCKVVFVFIFKTTDLDRFRQSFEAPRDFTLVFNEVGGSRAKVTFTTTWQVSFAKIADVSFSAIGLFVDLYCVFQELREPSENVANGSSCRWCFWSV